MNTQSLIHEFLEQQRFTMVGVSRNPKDFSRSLFKEFIKQGYDVVPVNPYVHEIEQRRCYTRLDEIKPGTASVLLMTSLAETESLIHECAESGVSLVWLYGISGMKNVSERAVRLCREYGLKVIPGYCPFMFMPSSPWFHHLHGSVWKWLGKYPN